MLADVLIEHHGSVALFTPMRPDARQWTERSNRGSGSDAPSPANSVATQLPNRLHRLPLPFRLLHLHRKPTAGNIPTKRFF